MRRFALLLASQLPLAGGAAPNGLGDVNGDTVTNVSDVFYFINFLFANGPAPL